MKYLFKIILLISILNFVNSQTLDQINYNCILNLATNLGLLTYVPLNASSFYDFCGSSSSYIRISCQLNVITYLSFDQQTSMYGLVDSDLECLQNCTSITAYNSIISSGTIFSSTLTPKCKFIYIYSKSLTGVPITSSFSPYLDYIVIASNIQPPTVIPFSYFIKNRSFSFTSNNLAVTNVSHLITYENDLVDEVVMGTFNLLTSAIPLFNKISSPSVSLTLTPGFDQSSFSNLLTINNITSLSITTKSTTTLIDFPMELTQIKLTKTIVLNIPFNAPTSLIDLRGMNGLQAFTINPIGTQFSFNGGQFPFILPSSSTSIVYSNGLVSTLDFSMFQNFTTISFTSDKLTGSLPTFWDSNYYSKLRLMILDNNQLSSTLDSSYCALDISLSYNQLSGEIPSCFTCFFGLTSGGGADFQPLKQAFAGNLFTNYNPYPPCTTMVPNIEYLGYQKPQTGQNYHLIHVWGKDLGIIRYAFSIQQIIATGYSCNWEIVKSNSLVACKLMTAENNPPPKVITYSYKFDTNLSFKLSWDPLQPQIESVNWQSDQTQLVIDGSYFSYNSSVIDITIGTETGYEEITTKCNVTKTTFNQITCSLGLSIDPLYFSDIPTIITIGNLSTQITITPGIINTIINCTSEYNDCNGNGYCITSNGTCICNASHQGLDCATDYKECLIIDKIVCNGVGSCNNVTGECLCDSNHQGINCELPLILCAANCNNVGICNNQTGVCDCQNNELWIGNNCNIASLYVSSISPSSINGGNASFYGWFGFNHTELQVLIGNKSCEQVYSITENELICLAPPNTPGKYSIKINQDSTSYSANNIYNYYETDGLKCPNDCTSSINGNCNSSTGYCNCISNWHGYDCSLFKDKNKDGQELPGSESEIKPNGETNINNEQTSFQILITKLLEVNINGETVIQYQLQDKWTLNKQTSNETIYNFEQTINNGCKIIYRVEQIINGDKLIEFAGIQYKIDKDSVKISISIENYKYSSNLNTLQLQMISSIKNDDLSKQVNDCSDNHQIEMNNFNQKDDESLNNLIIKKDSKVFVGNFINRVESDGRSSFMYTSILSKSNDTMVVQMSLPHCKKCLIDPNFSILISSDYKLSCKDDSNSWLLPVAVAVPICSVFIFAGAIMLYFKKKQTRKFLSKLKKINK